MASAGSIESVLLLEREYKALQRDPSHRPNFYFLIDRLISNLRHIPRTVFGPPAGEEERAKLTELREEAEEAEAAHRIAEEADEGSTSRKRKFEGLEEKKRALEEENDGKRKELEEESRRLKAVEEAERRAREQRAKNPRTARRRRSRRKLQKLTLQHVRMPNKLIKTSFLHFRRLRKRLKHSRSLWEEPWKLQLFSAVKRSMPSSMLRPRTCPQVKARPRIPTGLKIKSGKRKLSEGSSKSEKQEGSEVPTSTSPLEDSLRMVKDFWNARTHRSQMSGKESYEKSY